LLLSSLKGLADGLLAAPLRAAVLIVLPQGQKVELWMELAFCLGLII
jgi:hypothetical protein